MAQREKSGFWVSAVAVLFYPLTWLTKSVYLGADRIPRQGGALLVMNHVSHYDPAVDAVFVHRHKRVPRVLAKDGVFKIPVFGRMASGAGAIPVYRGSASAKESLSAALAALADGKFVLIYPEGTITRDPTGWPMQPRTGVARLALESDVPVIPAARWGTQEILNGYSRRFRPLPRKKVVFKVGDPVDLSSYRGKPITGQLLREVTVLIMDRVRELLAEIRDEPAPKEFFRPSARANPSPAGHPHPVGPDVREKRRTSRPPTDDTPAS